MMNLVVQGVLSFLWKSHKHKGQGTNKGQGKGDGHYNQQGGSERNARGKRMLDANLAIYNCDAGNFDTNDQRQLVQTCPLS